MNDGFDSRHILIIDQQGRWRKMSSKSLENAGHTVDTISDYAEAIDLDLRPALPDLTILGCPIIGYEENELIARLLETGHNLVVLCSSLPQHLMRTLFLAGAEDVVDKPQQAEHIVTVVNEALENLTQNDSYHAPGKQGGTVR